MVVDSRLARLLYLIGSAGVHVVGAWAGGIVWILVLLFMCFGGIPADDRYAFRWDNPFFQGPRSEDEDFHGEDGIVIVPPRRFRPLPEMEKPREVPSWDSRKLPFDEQLGSPSPLESFRTRAVAFGFMKARGDSLDFVSDKPFRGKGTYDVLGVASGGGGCYGSSMVQKDAVQLGLLWLARHQNEDGSWSEGVERCGRALPNGRATAGACEGTAPAREPLVLTSLALLAFEGAGYHREAEDSWDGLRYREILAQALRFLSRTPDDPPTRALVLLARTAAGEAPEDLFNAVAADPPAPEGSDLAAWKSLALVSAARAGLKPRPSRLQEAMAMLKARAPLDPGAWPGPELEGSYLRLLASFERLPTLEVDLPFRTELYPRLRAGQARDVDACREGSWEPAGGEGRTMSTILHVLALEALPGYASRLGYPLRE